MTTAGAPAAGVTEREHEVLVLVAAHLTNLEIAERLTLSVRTVESHVSSLIRKLDVADRRALVRRADELGLLRPRRPDQWPRPADPFVGREAEAVELGDRVREHRLVTVTGPGGVGKTRLTTTVVHELARHRTDGAWFVDLSQVSTPTGVLPAVATAVGVVEPPGQSLQKTLAGVLRSSDGLLLLDNCEHLLPELEAEVERLVRDCPALTVVATSRAPLRAPYEWVYELPSLATSDAVELFRLRAEAAGGVVPDDPRVAELCRRLDGMALAVELAAARYPVLGLDGLAAALDEPLRVLDTTTGDRRRSLRAAIAWSVDLLDDDARDLLARLCVFAARFTVASAHEVARRDRSMADAARVLATLADQHLLYVDPGSPTRYSFQEVVRQYAAELLGGLEREVQGCHAGWAARELAALGSPSSEQWQERFDEVAVEVRAALSRPLDNRLLGEQFAEALVQRGRLEEAQHRFETLAATASADARDRVHLLRQAAGAAVARLVGDEAIRLLDQTVETALAEGIPDAAADALGWSVIYAAFHPGTMAEPPGDDDIGRRLSEAQHLARPGTAAEATVAVAASLRLPDDDPRAEDARRRAAEQAVAAGLPVLASAALDGVCSSQLPREEFAEAVATIRARGALMDPLPLTAATAYAFNDYLLMGCEISQAAGDLRGAWTYAERLAALPCYRDYAHPALGRRLQVDLLMGDLDGAVARGDRFLASWERAGRHRASTLAVGTYAVALAHGLLGNARERDEWSAVTDQLLEGPHTPANVLEVGWAPTMDAWLLLDRDRPDDAWARLAVGLDDPVWNTSTIALRWRPWYAAAWAEAAALCQAADLDRCLVSARAHTRNNPVAAALVRRAAALARGDGQEVAALAATFDELGAVYQRDRSRRLSGAQPTGR